ncbi:FHA domain-containing protein [Malonomonas rubra DSM 5091]|uniref:FHA domain-containing protein n=1 Tax=Malonomonas rubra DSM 5091 TaxID=1122189 RepID=A0A1M6GN55_MALRU|nr:FHA domain-containing protein [Malonomonas rubra]SHJ11352.1 FHA domain-containing protein [Malonomonas rubra DSM 5091]
MLQIELRYENATLASYETENEQVSIGRNPKNDIQIDNMAVSSFHAVVKKVMNAYFIEDLNSTNGTFVNEKKIDKYELLDGDRIIIGKHQLHFRFGAKASQPAQFDETMVLDTKRQKELLEKNR